jgi:hypothetical protein
MASLHPYGEFTFRVIECLPGGKVVAHIALAMNIRVARAAFYAILPERPGRLILLQQGARIILDSTVEEDRHVNGIDPMVAGPERR